jgi:GAF domain-containing protein
VNTEGTWELGDLLEGQNLVLELIARGESLYQVLDTLLRIIQLQCPGMLASILLLDPDGIHVRHGAAPDLPEEYVRDIDGLAIGPQAGSCGTAAFTRRPVVVGDIATDPLWNDYREMALKHDLRACWSTPIFDSEWRVLGTFAMYFRVPGLPNETHVRLIEISTHIAAIAITKHRSEEEIRRRGR